MISSSGDTCTISSIRRSARLNSVADAASLVTRKVWVSRFTMAGGSSPNSVVSGPARGDVGRNTSQHSPAVTSQAHLDGEGECCEEDHGWSERAQAQGIHAHFGQPPA